MWLEKLKPSLNWSDFVSPSSWFLNLLMPSSSWVSPSVAPAPHMPSWQCLRLVLCDSKVAVPAFHFQFIGYLSHHINWFFFSFLLKSRFNSGFFTSIRCSFLIHGCRLVLESRSDRYPSFCCGLEQICDVPTHFNLRFMHHDQSLCFGRPWMESFLIGL